MKRLAVILLSVFFLSLSGAFAQDVSVQQSKKKKLEAEISMLEKQLQENKHARENKLSTLSLVKRKVEATRELVAESRKELNRINDSVWVKTKEMKKVQAHLDTMTFYYCNLIKNAYKNRDARIWYMYILASDNLSQASRRYAYLRNLSIQMNIQARKIKETQARLGKELEELQILQTKAKKAKAQHESVLASQQREQAQLTKLIDDLKKEKDRYTKSLESKKKQVDALNKEIEKIIADAIREREKKKKAGEKIDYTLAAEFEANYGKLPWPVQGSVVESFGQHAHPVYKTIKMPFNNGVNIAVSRNSSVSAVFNGVVKKIIVVPGYNKCVLVQHGNYFTFYCKLASVSVKAGQKISTGQTIGTVDTIDDETQLHFELWKGTVRQNPESWLRPL